MLSFSEHRDQTLKDLITSNKCSNNERIPLTDIASEMAEEPADVLLESDWKVLIKKVKVARSRRAPHRESVSFSSGVFLIHKMVIGDILKLKGSA